MELTCRQCNAKFRANVQLPLTQPVRVVCPSCSRSMVLRPSPGGGAEPMRTDSGAARAIHELPRAPGARRRQAVIADEPREFREFLGKELRGLGFDVRFFDSGDGVYDHVRHARADLLIVNVYLRGRLGVDISEEVKADPALAATKVILIGALFRANRFRANPTNLYGADEYIEEQIPEKELHQIIHKLFPDGLGPAAFEEPKEFDEARRLARLILSDIVIYNADKVDSGIRHGNFFELLEGEIEDGRQYYEARISPQVREKTDFFNETLHLFVEMKREEMGDMRTGTESDES